MAFRALMATFPTGVSVVTTIDGDGLPRGMTCSSVCSVTTQPPTLLVCLRTASPTLAAVLDHGRFAVNLLHRDAKSTAELFASGDPLRFSSVHWRDDGDGLPQLVDDAHAVARCQVTASQRVGDHTVVFGEVAHVTCRPQARPLLYGLRSYLAWPH